MDIKLTDDGDLYSQTIVIKDVDQTVQSVLIRMRRFRGEWVRNEATGLPYYDWKERKNGNLLEEIRDRTRAEILRVPGVISVDKLQVRIDPNTRDVDYQIDVSIFDPERQSPVVLQLDTWEGTARVTT